MERGGKNGKKEREGGDGGPLCGKGVERGRKEGEGRDVKKEGEAGDGGPLRGKGGSKGR